MATQTNSALPDGTEIGGYRILRKIASGGFSIVYLARDAEDAACAIKEYLPASLVRRGPGESSPTIPEDCLGTYRHGLKSFFEEGRALARIFHPNVVRVVNFFRANDTVYMVMAYERGRSLQDVILRHRAKGKPKVMEERHIRRVFGQVMQGLREVHANRLLHLDLKPANVYIRFDGTPLLLDFGAARQALSADTTALFPMYTPGFAAPELHHRSAALGPWTDIYGIGATLFACMAAAPPQPADQRASTDRLEDMLAGLAGVYSEALIQIVRACLALDPMNRPQSVFAVQRALRQVPPVDEPAAHASHGRWRDTIAGLLGGRGREDHGEPAAPRQD